MYKCKQHYISLHIFCWIVIVRGYINSRNNCKPQQLQMNRLGWNARILSEHDMILHIFAICFRNMFPYLFKLYFRGLSEDVPLVSLPVCHLWVVFASGTLRWASGLETQGWASLGIGDSGVSGLRGLGWGSSLDHKESSCQSISSKRCLIFVKYSPLADWLPYT